MCAVALYVAAFCRTEKAAWLPKVIPATHWSLRKRAET
jgi:hypothetical protein